MNQKIFTKSKIATSLSLALGATSLPVISAEQVQVAKEKLAEIEEIVVSGTRANLQDAQSTKRMADTFVDAISSKDIGSLPDKSILEAISRVPGVAIERFAGKADPDHFGTEASGAVLRGMTHVRTSFNGRDSFSANSGRGLSFEDVTPELAAGVMVYKNQSADLVEGGIGGTIDVRTRQPFDQEGRLSAVNVEYNYGDMEKDGDISVSGIFSNRWEIESGEVGLLINLADESRQSQSQGVQLGTLFTNDGDRVPEGIAFRQKSDDRKRKGTTVALQWASKDETMLATAQFIRSDASLAWSEYAIETDEDQNNQFCPLKAGGTDQCDEEFTFSGELGDSRLFESGVIGSNEGWRGSGDYREPWGNFGVRNVFQSRYQQMDNVVDDASFNFKWSPSEKFDVEMDYQHVSAKSQVQSYSLMLAARAGASIAGVEGSTAPNLNFVSPDGTDDTEWLATPSNYYWRSAMDHLQNNDGEEDAALLNVEYHIESGWARSIKAGVRWSKRDQITRESDYNWGVLSEAWAGGSAYMDSDAAAAAGLQDSYDTVSFAGFSNGDVLNNGTSTDFIFPSMALARDYASWDSAFGLAGRGWNPVTIKPNEINNTSSTNKAAFVKFNFGGEAGSFDVSGNIGLRYVQLDHETDGFISFPDIDGSSISDGFLPQEDRDFGNGFYASGVGKGDYSNVLPSLNVKINLQDDLILRLGASEAIALPDLGLLRYHINIDEQEVSVAYPDDCIPGPDAPCIPESAEVGFYKGSGGNPALEPMEADMYDASLEWYFDDVGSLTFSLFRKNVSNFFVVGFFEESYSNNGVTKPVRREGASNGGKGSIDGFEIAYQQFFDDLPGAWSGLGVQANWTRANSSGAPNTGLKSDDPSTFDEGADAFENLPFEGLSKDTYNLALMYEYDDISARLAYNWRSDYLITTRDVITKLPIYNDDYGQLDGSFSYQFSDRVSVKLQLTNILDETTRTLQQVGEGGELYSRSWFVKDRTAAFIIKVDI